MRMKLPFRTMIGLRICSRRLLVIWRATKELDDLLDWCGFLIASMRRSADWLDLFLKHPQSNATYTF